MMRPEVTAFLSRYGETLIACAVVVLGLWFLTAPGPVVRGFGVLVALAGAGWALTALRRARFRAEGEAPGVVDVVEGAVRYMGPVTGGAIALSELAAIDVLIVGGTQRCWRLRQIDGQTVLIPQAAEGAEALHDVFAALPGLRVRDLGAALRHTGDAPLAVWRRSAVRAAEGAVRLSAD
jgi:hypothetical protein